MADHDPPRDPGSGARSWIGEGRRVRRGPALAIGSVLAAVVSSVTHAAADGPASSVVLGWVVPHLPT